MLGVQDAGIQGGAGSRDCLETQVADLKDDFRRYKKEMDDKHAAMQAELHKCGSIAFQLYQYIISAAAQGPPAIMQVNMQSGVDQSSQSSNWLRVLGFITGLQLCQQG